MKRVHVTVALTIDIDAGDVDSINDVSRAVNAVIDSGGLAALIETYGGGTAPRRVRGAAVTAVYPGIRPRPVKPRKPRRATYPLGGGS